MKIHTSEIDTPNTEAHKLRLAQVGAEYLQETADPARLLDRARQAWRQQGRSDEWIAQRMTGQETGDKPTEHVSESALIFAALAELSTQQIAENVVASGMAENKSAAQSGGHITAQAHQQLESQTSKPVVTGTNYLPPVAGKSMKTVKASRKA